MHALERHYYKLTRHLSEIKLFASVVSDVEVKSHTSNHCAYTAVAGSLGLPPFFASVTLSRTEYSACSSAVPQCIIVKCTDSWRISSSVIFSDRSAGAYLKSTDDKRLHRPNPPSIWDHVIVISAILGFP